MTKANFPIGFVVAWGLEDGAAAIENILLASTALGYGSRWLEGYTLPRETELKVLLDILDGKRLWISIGITSPNILRTFWGSYFGVDPIVPGSGWRANGMAYLREKATTSRAALGSFRGKQDLTYKIQNNGPPKRSLVQRKGMSGYVVSKKNLDRFGPPA